VRKRIRLIECWAEKEGESMDVYVVHALRIIDYLSVYQANQAAKNLPYDFGLRTEEERDRIIEVLRDRLSSYGSFEIEVTD